MKRSKSDSQKCKSSSSDILLIKSNIESQDPLNLQFNLADSFKISPVAGSFSSLSVGSYSNNSNSSGIRKQLSFFSYEQQTKNIQCLNLPSTVIRQEDQSIKGQKDDQIQQQQQHRDQFTHSERQSLKNAFRYICRLVFKEASAFWKKIHQIVLQQLNKQQGSHNSNREKANSNKANQLQKKDPKQYYLNLFQGAQLISGQRYFKQYIEKLSQKDKHIVLKYMIWFLEVKYLRYINKCSNENKGKRKQMKKQLYLRFKNCIMLPYLDALLKSE